MGRPSSREREAQRARDEKARAEQDREARRSQLSPVDHLMREYEARLEKIYTDRTAGDHTFLGVLAEFREELRRLDAEK